MYLLKAYEIALVTVAVLLWNVASVTSLKKESDFDSLLLSSRSLHFATIQCFLHFFGISLIGLYLRGTSHEDLVLTSELADADSTGNNFSSSSKSSLRSFWSSFSLYRTNKNSSSSSSSSGIVSNLLDAAHKCSLVQTVFTHIAIWRLSPLTVSCYLEKIPVYLTIF